MRYAMAIDTRKCVGCGDCVVACQEQYDIPAGYCRSWIAEQVKGKYPNVSMEMRSERCNHCADAPCVVCCPTDSSHISEGGIVLTDPDLCIGCGACIESCPYDARYFDPVNGNATKCTFCHERVAGGKLPACVEVCPTYCMFFGDLDDPNAEITKLLRERDYKTLKPEMGTEPHIFYLS